MSFVSLLMLQSSRTLICSLSKAAPEHFRLCWVSWLKFMTYVSQGCRNWSTFSSGVPPSWIDGGLSLECWEVFGGRSESSWCWSSVQAFCLHHGKNSGSAGSDSLWKLLSLLLSSAYSEFRQASQRCLCFTALEASEVEKLVGSSVFEMTLGGDLVVARWPLVASLPGGEVTVSHFEGLRTVPVGLGSGENIVEKESKNLNELVRAFVHGKNIPEKLTLETQWKALERSMNAILSGWWCWRHFSCSWRRIKIMSVVTSCWSEVSLCLGKDLLWQRFDVVVAC